ncbi:DUF5908 family protein [Tenacibaculum jejuense]|uniref:Uncharacterized protein n=1 Tax=Tenacibaculum jejuense TaxID=584609 RepID=A0A238U7V2_9FLAO|nr:DUF5908 family protein [Tenacibaculum jejuense]SNR14678.1 conserved protein of unknown function [Tenacibaculum jejuense]
MPIEIRELIIKVKVEESITPKSDVLDTSTIKETIASICKKEVKKQLQKLKER